MSVCLLYEFYKFMFMVNVFEKNVLYKCAIRYFFLVIKKKIQLKGDLSKYHSYKTILNAANQASICFLYTRIKVYSYLFCICVMIEFILQP